jgi:hypothetical protein
MTASRWPRAARILPISPYIPLSPFEVFDKNMQIASMPIAAQGINWPPFTSITWPVM